MRVKFWGVRGSIPVPGLNTAKFGGNTPCIQMISDGEDILVLDAGTGIREFGTSIQEKRPIHINILLTHTHWDHIHGFPFFIPAFIKGNKIDIYGPVHYEKSLSEIMGRQMDYSYFPVRSEELLAEIRYHDLKEGEFKLGGYDIKTKYMNHSVLTIGYKISKGGKSFIYTGDNEPYYNFLSSEEDSSEVAGFIDEQNESLVEFIRGVDLLVYDSMYLAEEYEEKRGWGHSSIIQAIDIAVKGKVKRLVLFHHEPMRTDNQLDEIKVVAMDYVSKSSWTELEVVVAREGETLNL